MSKIPEISVEELKAKIERKDPFVLLDVREMEEHQEARIPGSVLIPLGELPQRVEEIDSAVEVVVHCRSGGRSAQATEFLCSRGYKAVNVAGGILAWAQRVDPTLTLGPGNSCRRS
ncbi:MAG: hypothetical protein KGL04_06320 [Elusimicrobia bacterium]|nr:hypothetical protein [Elusimicrobiota bacterium]MDE2313769.1 hypothetical protein [Elusimicrobiota bacterium]